MHIWVLYIRYVQAVRYHNTEENGIRFHVSTISDTEEIQNIELDVSDKFLHSHFIKSFNTSTKISNELTNEIKDDLKLVQVQDATYLTETDKVNILISHFEFQPTKVRNA